MMGTLQLVANADNLPHDVLERIYLTDFNGNPTHCRAFWEKTPEAGALGVLGLQFESEDSYYVNVPWLTESGAEFLLSTATLRQRAKPYVLPLEILRGILHRITNQVAEWQAAGFTVVDQSDSRLSRALTEFSKAATKPHDMIECHGVSVQATAMALELLDDIGSRLTEQFVAANKDSAKATLIGGRLPRNGSLADHAETFCSVFDTAAIDTNWRDVENEDQALDWSTVDEQLAMAQKNNLRIIAGPLLRLNSYAIPERLLNSLERPESMAQYAMDFATAAFQQLKGNVQLWHVASGLNQIHGHGFDDEARLRLTAELVQHVRKQDAKTPALVSVSQPWGEHVAQHQDLAPLSFIDALVRSRVGLSAIGLDLDLDYWPGGTTRRDFFELLRRIDQWSQFGLPLVIFLSAPSRQEDSERAIRATHSRVSEDSQSNVLSRLVSLGRAHPAVQGVIWKTWQDADGIAHAGSGLLDRDGRSKAALSAFKG